MVFCLGYCGHSTRVLLLLLCLPQNDAFKWTSEHSPAGAHILLAIKAEVPTLAYNGGRQGLEDSEPQVEITETSSSVPYLGTSPYDSTSAYLSPGLRSFSALYLQCFSSNLLLYLCWSFLLFHLKSSHSPK